MRSPPSAGSTPTIASSRWSSPGAPRPGGWRSSSASARSSTTRRCGASGSGARPSGCSSSASAETRAALDAYASGVNAWVERAAATFRPSSDAPPPAGAVAAVDSVAVIFLMARSSRRCSIPPKRSSSVCCAPSAPPARELAGDADAPILAEIERLARATAAVRRSSAVGPRGRARQQQLGGRAGAHRLAERSGRERSASRPRPARRLVSGGLPLPISEVGDDDAGRARRGPRPRRALAWAFTNLYVDDVDLFFERLDPSGTKVLRGEAWVPIRVERE